MPKFVGVAHGKTLAVAAVGATAREFNVSPFQIFEFRLDDSICSITRTTSNNLIADGFRNALNIEKLITYNSGLVQIRIRIAPCKPFR